MNKHNLLERDFNRPGNVIFERKYVENVLGLNYPLTESGQLSAAFQRKIIQEQLLLEGFFGDFASLGKNLRNAGLAFRYIIEDPKRIGSFIAEIWASMQSMASKLFGWITFVLENLKYLGEKALAKAKAPIAWLKNMHQKVKELIETIQGMSGWKKAIAACGALVGVTYIYKKVEKIKKPIEAGFKGLVKVVDKVAEKTAEQNEALNPMIPSLMAAVFDSGDNDRLDEFVKQWFQDTRGKYEKTKKKKEKGMTAQETGDADTAKKAKLGDNILKFGEKAFDEATERYPDEVDSIMEPLLELMTMFGKKVLEYIGRDALIGAVTGGWGIAVKYLGKAFGGISFVLSVLSPALAKFTGQMKDAETEMEEALKDEGDPTEGDTKEPEQVEEAVIRYTVRKLIETTY